MVHPMLASELKVLEAPSFTEEDELVQEKKQLTFARTASPLRSHKLAWACIVAAVLLLIGLVVLLLVLLWPRRREELDPAGIYAWPFPMNAQVCIDEGSADLVAVRRADCPKGYKVYRGVGVNIFDALWDSESAAEHALESLAATGMLYFRMFGSLHGARMIEWTNEPHKYWAKFDWLMDLIEAKRLHAIISLGVVEPSLAGESFNQLVTDNSSSSRNMTVRYMQETVRRYAHRPRVLFWELGDELNNRVNVPSPSCHHTDHCFDTQALVAFTEQLVQVIRAIDPERPISSGMSLPAPEAWHMEHCTEGKVPGTPCASGAYGLDTRTQWMNMLARQQQATDIMSVHIHPEKCYFHSPHCASYKHVIEVAAEVAKRRKQLLFVGQYYGEAPHHDVFPSSVLDLQVESARVDSGQHAFALSAYWAWECFTRRSAEHCVFSEEQEGQAMVSHLRRANSEVAEALAGSR